MGTKMSEPWARHAARWNLLGPPLRPVAEDMERLRAAWRNSTPMATGGRPAEILSLGVTPEIALFDWAAEQRLTAVDGSEAMIGAVWPGDTARRKAVLSNWMRMPFEAGSFDLILCDGGLAPVVGTERIGALGRELARLLGPGGRVAMRHFARPEKTETVEAVASAARQGQIGNFHELKLRLLMALQGRDFETGVELGETWECFSRLFTDREALAARVGCSLETVGTIDAYKDSRSRYSFPNLAEVANAFDLFTLREGPAGGYPFAECCPVFTLTPRL